MTKPVGFKRAAHTRMRPTIVRCLVAAAMAATVLFVGTAPARRAVAAAAVDCSATGGTLVNGATECGTITAPGETHTWTFTATVGDHIGVEIGEITDNGAFTPWIRLSDPNGNPLVNGSGASGASAASLDAPGSATTTGTYTVLVASNDFNHLGTGTYQLSETHTPGPVTISAGDEGGPLTNGATATGTISTGDLDTWTFTATANDHIGVEIGEVTDTNANFTPWIRLWAP